MQNKIQIPFVKFKQQVKNLSDCLLDMEKALYDAHQIEISGRWIVLLRELHEVGHALCISDLARNSNRTHPDIHHITTQMEGAGLIESQPDPIDGRKRTVIPTRLGREWIERLLPIWNILDAALDRWMEPLMPDWQVQWMAIEDSVHAQQPALALHTAHKLDFQARLSFQSWDAIELSNPCWLEMMTFMSARWPQVQQKTIDLLPRIQRDSELHIQGYALVHEGSPIGLAALQRKSIDIFELSFFWIQESVRLRGAGQELISKLMEVIWKENGKYLIVYVHPIMVGYLAFLKKLNFVESTHLLNHYPAEHPSTSVWQYQVRK